MTQRGGSLCFQGVDMSFVPFSALVIFTRPLATAPSLPRPVILDNSGHQNGRLCDLSHGLGEKRESGMQRILQRLELGGSWVELISEISNPLSAPLGNDT